MQDKQILTIRIKDLRRERSLTQEALADALGVSRQSINAMEAGRCLPSLPVAFQLASFFAVPLQVLFSLQEEMEMEEERRQSLSPSLQVIEQEEAPMANVVPWSPLRDMREMLDELMDESVAWSPQASVSAPAANISQTDKEVHIEMRLPGYQREDISLEVGEDFVTVSGSKNDEQSSDKQYFRREFMAQSFTRTMSLPALVHTDSATAEMKHGILVVTLPKVVEEKPKTKRLEIKATD